MFPRSFHRLVWPQEADLLIPIREDPDYQFPAPTFGVDPIANARKARTKLEPPSDPGPEKWAVGAHPVPVGSPSARNA